MCNHREAIPGDECLLSIVGKIVSAFSPPSFPSPSRLLGDKNKHRYVIATQSHPLRVKLRAIPGTPIVHINRSVMILEPPSDATLKVKEMVCIFFSLLPSSVLNTLTE
jgi:U3 small nucleolar RNA-associated protein 23